MTILVKFLLLTLACLSPVWIQSPFAQFNDASASPAAKDTALAQTSARVRLVPQLPCEFILCGSCWRAVTCIGAWN